MDLPLLFAFLQAVLGVVSNNTLSQSKKDSALSYLALLGEVVKAKGKINDALKLLTDRINSGEALTEADFESLKARSDKAHKTIQESGTIDPPPTE